MRNTEPENKADDIEFDKDGGGTTATLVVGGLIVLMIVALAGLLYLTFAN